jgi:hypothetical protein
MPDRRDRFGNLFRVVDVLEQLRGESEGRIEEDQRISLARDFLVLELRLRHQGGASGDVRSRRVARGHDALGIDAQFAGVFAKPADSGSRVIHAFFGCDAVTRRHAIIGPCRHHPPAGEIPRLSLELPDCPVLPAAAEEKHNTGPFIGRFPPGGKVDKDSQVSLLRLAVSEGLDVLLSKSRANNEKRQQNNNSRRVESHDRSPFFGRKARGWSVFYSQSLDSDSHAIIPYFAHHDAHWLQ